MTRTGHLSLAFCAASLVFPSEIRAQAVASPAASLGSPTSGADGYLYISAQGPRRADGSIPASFPEQARQCLDKISRLANSSGLTMEHVVYVQVYLEDVTQYSALNEVFSAYFPKDPPARAVLGVAKVPDSPLQITAVAVRDLKDKRAVAVPGWPVNKAFAAGTLTHDRFFISTQPGTDPSTGAIPAGAAAQVDLALDRLTAVLQAAGLTNANMVFVNPYLTTDLPTRIMNERYARRFEFGNTPGRATIEVSALPEGARVAFTGVAVRDVNRRRAVRPKNMPPSPTASPCVFTGETLYCSAKSGFIPGPNGGVYFAATSDQARQTMRNLLDNLEEAEMTFEDVVYTTIYLDDLNEKQQFGDVYMKYFKQAPAQTMLQQLKPGDRSRSKEGQYPDLEQVSLIAVKGGAKIQ